MIARRWMVAEPDPRLVASIAETHQIPPHLARVLVNRGHVGDAEVTQFLEPRLDRLSDPFLLPDMDKAVARVWQAIDQGEKVLIYGDYDVDGVTSTTVLTRFLRGLGLDPMQFIPHRIDDGYGLNVETFHAVNEAHAPDLIVTVDCGTGSVEAVQAAAEAGVDVIVTDHHETSAGVAPALAVVNPKLGEQEDLKLLAGVGVAFKLCHAVLKNGRDDGRELAHDFDLRSIMHLVAMGTVADMVPLVKENRILASYGITALNRCGEKGIKALGQVAGIREEMNAYHIGFLLGPRINAAGRMDSPAAALELLLSDDASTAHQLAVQLDDANSERQNTEKLIFDEAVKQIDDDFDAQKTFAIVVAAEGWHPGVVGIVASRLVQKYYRPVVVIGIDEQGQGKGSCRSIDAFDLVGGLSEVSSFLGRFGGHKMAAGLQIGKNEIPGFRSALNEVAEKALADEILVPRIKIDAWLEPREIGSDLLADIQRLTPFGLANATPVWAVRGVNVLHKREVGSGHLKLVVDLAGKPVDAIAFNRLLDELPEGALDLAFQLKLNRFRGEENLQLNLQDFRATETS